MGQQAGQGAAVTGILHAFVAGIGAGIALALCQAAQSWLYRRASVKRMEAAQAAITEHMARVARSGLYAVDDEHAATRSGKMN